MTATHERSEIAFSIQSSFPTSTIEPHIQVQPHSIRTSRKDLCLRCDGGGSVCDNTPITAGATSLMVQYCPTFVVRMAIHTCIHRFNVFSYRPTCEGLYTSITSPLICSNLGYSLSSIHSHILCGGALKFPSLSIIPPSGISCAIACCHNRKSLHGGFSFGNLKVDH